MIVDLLLSIGTLSFLIADAKQFHKLQQGKFPTNAISRTHLKIKLLALSCVTLAYLLLKLPISFVISLSQIMLVLGVTYYTYKYYQREGI